MNNNLLAEIIVDNKSRNTDKMFTYIIPDKYKNNVKAGMRVLVPFGNSNKLVEGMILKLKEDTNIDLIKLKYVVQIIDNYPILNDNMIKLIFWMKEKYLAQYVDIIKTMIPSGISNKVEIFYKINKEVDISAVEFNYEKKILEFLLNNGETEIQVLKENLKITNINRYLSSLIKKGIILEIKKLKSDVRKKYEKYVYLNEEKIDIKNILSNLDSRAYKQKEVLNYLASIKFLPLRQLMKDTQTSLSTIKNLEKKKYITIKDVEVNRNPIIKEISRYPKVELNTEQQECFNSICEDIKKGKNYIYLLHGVTGSGKTEVYLHVIEQMISNGKDAIVLVPEISLTPQTIERFVGRFGDNVAVLHSRLSLGERFDEWRKIKEGKVKIVVGARSAIFAPFSNLGIIIIDEEHENSYKSNMNPKYDAREIAEKRCEIEGASMILGSATPSIETYYRAQKGEIKLLKMNNRINKKNMPTMKIIDMTKELNMGNTSIFSRTLYNAIKSNLDNNKQTILFLNRRGFSTFVSCRKCGYVAKCEECDIAYTYHKSDNILKCHYCGLTMKPPKICPKCGSKYIKYFGVGTQKVEELVKKYFPKARVARMDVDTTTKKGSHEKILDKVKNRDIDILIGTQMISKGLDFPNVTLVGVIAADTSLNLPDFRSSERTFQLLTQVGGRAGRGEDSGLVIIQTYDPNHYSIEAAKKYDYIEFYNKEIMLRREFCYSPFSNIISILFISKIKSKVIEISNNITRLISLEISKEKVYSSSINIYGPNPAALSKIKNNYRWQTLIKCKDEELNIIKNIIKKLILQNNDLKLIKEVKISVDINPISIM